MKHWVTKRNVMLVSAGYVLYFLGLLLLSYACSDTWCRVHDDDLLGIILFTLAPLAIVFLLSLLTYRMHERVFKHWMGFALWATPLLMFFTFLINTGGSGSGMASVIGGAFDMLLFMILYGVYTGISLWRIYSAYRKHT